MNSRMQVLLTVLSLGVISLVAVPVSEADLLSKQWPAPPAVTFRTTPRWETIPGTRVARVSQDLRPDYDLFRYGSRYYLYNDGYWYRSDRLNTTFAGIAESRIPMAIANVPNPEWRSYPPGWTNPKNPHFSGRHDNGKRSGKKDYGNHR